MPRPSASRRQALGCINLVLGLGDEAQSHLRHAIALYDSGKVTPASYLIPDHFYAVGLVELGDLDGALDAAAAAARDTRNEVRWPNSRWPTSSRGSCISCGTLRRGDRGTRSRGRGRRGHRQPQLRAVFRVDPRTHRHAQGALDDAAAFLATGMARLGSGGSLFGADWLLDSQMQYLATTGDLDAAMNVAEFTWSQTESIHLLRVSHARRCHRAVGDDVRTCRVRQHRRRQHGRRLSALARRLSPKHSRSRHAASSTATSTN